MLKQVLHKTGSMLLAFIVLFSSFSFTVHEHICGGEIADISFFLEADSCRMDMNECTLEETKSTEHTLKKEPCCTNHSEIIQGTDTNQQAQQTLEITQVQFLTAFVYSYRNLFRNLDTKSTSFQEYSPPIVVKDIYMLYDTFRI